MTTTSLARWDSGHAAWYDLRTREYKTPSPDNPRDALDITARGYDARPNVGPMVSSFIPKTGVTVLAGPNPNHPLGWWVGYEFFNQVVASYYGAVFKHCIFHGSPADDSTFRSAVRYHAATDNTLGGMLFEDCAFINLNPNPWTNAIEGGFYTARRCEVRGFVDGFSFTNTTTSIQPTVIHGCWAHDGSWWKWTPGAAGWPSQPDGQTHNDGLQIQRGKNLEVMGTWFGGARVNGDPNAGDDFNNSGVMCSQVGSDSDSKVENVLIKHNTIEQGAAGINLAPAQGNTFASMDVIDNDFVVRTDPSFPSYIIINAGWAGEVSGNNYRGTSTPVPLTDHR